MAKPGKLPRRRSHKYINSKNGFVIPICNKCRQEYDPFCIHKCSYDTLNDYQKRKLK